VNKLQEIKNKRSLDEDGWNSYLNVSIEEIDWVIDELERANEDLRVHVQENKSLSVNNDLLIKEIERLREDIRFLHNRKKINDDITRELVALNDLRIKLY
jgi:hypothetical protein